MTYKYCPRVIIKATSMMTNRNRYYSSATSWIQQWPSPSSFQPPRWWTRYHHHRRMSTSATTAEASSSSSSSSFSFKIFQYAFGGWIFFIAENIILSENRNFIIDYVNDTSSSTSSTSSTSLTTTDNNVDESKYRMIYGTFSTIATVSILYGYRQLRPLRLVLPSTTNGGITMMKPPVTTASIPTVMAMTMISFGLVLVSQAFPKLQIPMEFSFSSSTTVTKEEMVTTNPTESIATTTNSTSTSTTTTIAPPKPTDTGFVFKVRCPFDFTDTKQNTTTTGNLESNVHGIDRITRHSGLWSFGCIGLGNAFLQPTLGLSLFMTGPVLVALLGGYHYDTRLQRHMGGSFPSITYEQQTSNVPFVAMILGQQPEQNCFNSLSTLMTQELKILNAAVAVVIGTLYVMLNKGRHSSYMAHMLSSQKVARSVK